MEAARLSLRNLGKAYNVPVLRGVGLEIGRGEVRALVGENGAGKSTLINILAGLVAPDTGEIHLDGERYDPRSARDAFAAGVSCSTQELSIIETLSVAENIGLRALPRRAGIIERGALDTGARRLLDRVSLGRVSTMAPGRDLSLGERQLVEIARAISADCRLLMLDEPTAALTSQQAGIVHDLIRELAAAGTSIIYVSHRLDDVLDVADRVTVLRDGVVISTNATSDVSTAELVERMSGGHVEPAAAAVRGSAAGGLSLSAVDLATRDLPQGIDLELRQGEIVGIAGLAGAGKSELLAALFGLVPLTGGAVRRCAEDRVVEIRNPRHAVANGIGFLGEDRRSMGLFPGQSVLTNMMLPDLARSATCILDRHGEREDAARLRERLSIRCESLRQDILQLSGGNQQKVLIARWLHCDADVLLLDEPTRGVDVGTKFAIHELFGKLATDGKSLLIASSELDELMAVCHRIVVMSNRRLAGSFDSDRWSEAEILACAFSQYATRSEPAARQRT